MIQPRSATRDCKCTVGLPRSRLLCCSYFCCPPGCSGCLPRGFQGLRRPWSAAEPRLPTQRYLRRLLRCELLAHGAPASLSICAPRFPHPPQKADDSEFASWWTKASMAETITWHEKGRCSEWPQARPKGHRTDIGLNGATAEKGRPGFDDSETPLWASATQDEIAQTAWI